MNKILLCSFPLALVAGAPVALADEPAKPAEAKAAPAEARKPPAELAALDFLAGNFNCSGNWYKSPTEAIPKKSKISSKWALDKYFLTFTYLQPKSKTQPFKIEGQGFWGYDPVAKKYVHAAINNVGMVSMMHADGGGDALVFKGQGSGGAAGGQSPVTFTFKKADKGFTITVEEEQGGKTVKMSDETCTK